MLPIEPLDAHGAPPGQHQGPCGEQLRAVSRQAEPDDLDDVVELHGLKALELNGQTGLVVEILKGDGEAAGIGLEIHHIL